MLFLIFKNISILSSHVLSHCVYPSFPRNDKGRANIGTEILSPLACNFIKNGVFFATVFSRTLWIF